MKIWGRLLSSILILVSLSAHAEEFILGIKYGQSADDVLAILSKYGPAKLDENVQPGPYKIIYTSFLYGHLSVSDRSVLRATVLIRDGKAIQMSVESPDVVFFSDSKADVQASVKEISAISSSFIDGFKKIYGEPIAIGQDSEVQQECFFGGGMLNTIQLYKYSGGGVYKISVTYNVVADKDRFDIAMVPGTLNWDFYQPLKECRKAGGKLFK